MHDVVDVKLRYGLTDLANQFARPCTVQLAAALDELLQGLAGHVVVDDDELVGHLVRCLDVGETRAVYLGERRPDATAGTCGGDALAHEGASPVQGDKLGYATLPARENALHVVGVINAHCMHYLVVIQALGPVPHVGIADGLHLSMICNPGWALLSWQLNNHWASEGDCLTE